MESQALHAGNLPVCVCFLRVDNFYVIERFPAPGSISRSEDIDCSNQINLAYRGQSKEERCAWARPYQSMIALPSKRLTIELTNKGIKMKKVILVLACLGALGLSDQAEAHGGGGGGGFHGGGFHSAGFHGGGHYGGGYYAGGFYPGFYGDYYSSGGYPYYGTNEFPYPSPP